jgi:hypothetical protein
MSLYSLARNFGDVVLLLGISRFNGLQRRLARGRHFLNELESESTVEFSKVKTKQIEHSLPEVLCVGIKPARTSLRLNFESLRQ